MEYVFILGNNHQLSVSEIKAVLPSANVVKNTAKYLLIENTELDCQLTVEQLGGTIKMGKVLSLNYQNSSDLAQIITTELQSQYGDKKIKFGLSFYGMGADKKIGMTVKRQLKDLGISSRLVVSRDSALSSVIVTKEKVIDFLVGPDFLGVTCAVQDFKNYGRRDFGRPKSDALSGMLPPKLAKMMINLSGVQTDQIILDPFCGSGTILTEALAMGFKQVIGSDNSVKAVSDAKDNVEWLLDKFDIDGVKHQIFVSDVLTVADKVGTVDAIITEPYLGKPIRGGEDDKEIFAIRRDLEKLYVSAFGQFKKILSVDGKVVMVFPQWHLHSRIWQLDIDESLKKLGFNRLDKGDLIYSRQDQKVWREVHIYAQS